MRNRVVSDAAPGFDVLLGRLRVRIVHCEASFEVNGLHPRVQEIEPPGATIGRSPDADLRVVGPDAGDISRVHLAVWTSAWQWTVADRHTTNGTCEAADVTGGWRSLPSFPIPIADRLDLRLGSSLRLRLEVMADGPAGSPTPDADPSRGRARRIGPPELEQLARALLAGHRGAGATPSAEQLAVSFFVSRATIYRRLEELRELPEMNSVARGRSPSQIADALAAVFPYLTGE
jgi:hypothetical protein